MKRAIALLLAFVFVFALIPVSALAAGSVTVENGGVAKVGGSPVGASVEGGVEVTLEPTGKTGKVFASWTSGQVTITNDSFRMPDTGNVTVTAVYRSPKVTAAGMSIKVQTAEPVSGVATAEQGNLITVTAPLTNAAGGTLKSLTATGGFSSDTEVLSFTMPGDDVTVTAKYEYALHLTNAGAVKDGTATPAITAAEEGWTVQVTAEPPANYRFKNWTSADVTFADASASPTTFTMPAKPVTVAAECEQLFDITLVNAKRYTDNTYAAESADANAAAGDTVYVKAYNSDTAAVFGATWTNTGIANQTAEQFSFTMPNTPVTVKANYKYTVTSTETDATFSPASPALPGGTVEATAADRTGATSPEKFLYWTSSDITISDTEKTDNPLSFLMPEKAVALTPHYGALHNVSMLASVTGVSGVTYSFNGGTAVTQGKQVQDDEINISAPETATVGGVVYRFVNWTSSGTGDVIADANSRATILTVGSANTNITANYARQVTMTVKLVYGTKTVNKTYTFYQGQSGATLTAAAVDSYSFVKWSGSAVTGTGSIAAAFDEKTDGTITFNVPADATALSVTANYQPYYTLTINGVSAADVTINGTAATELPVKVPAGSAIVITSNESGVREFSKWTVSPAMATTVDLTQKTLSFTMPAKAQTVTATYTTSAEAEHITGAYLTVEYNGSMPSANNQRYYARQEFVHNSGDFDVKMAPTADVSATETVAAEDLYFFCRPTGGGDWFNARTTGFLSLGTFDLKVEYRVAGKLIAISPEYKSAIVVLARRPEYIVMAQAPTNTSMFLGDAIDMSGSYVWLKAADKDTNGGSIYYDVRELTSSQYKVWPKWDNTQGTYLYEDGSDALQTDSKGRFIEIVLAYKDPTQADKEMTWIKPTDGKDRIDILETATAGTLKLTASTTATSGATPDVFAPTSGVAVKDNPGKWTITYGTNGTRYVTADFDIPAGSTATKESFVSGWTNSDPSVATITAVAGNPLRYEIRVISSGETTVSVQMKGSGETASFKLHVLSSEDENQTKVDGFQLNPSSLELYVGSRFAVGTQNFSPANASTVISKWESVYQDDGTDASYCVSVDETGTVTVNHYTDEKVIIRAIPKYRINDTIVAECVLTIRKVAVTNMTLSPTVLSLFNKASKQLTATILPEGATDKTVNWTTSDSNVVSVDANGIVTGNKVGTATITATSADNTNVKKTCTVTVVASILATSLELSRTNLTLGLNETTTLTAYIAPSNATTQAVVWSSDNTNVATVDANGKVTSINAGIATITAAINDGSGLTASCLITVSKIISNAVTLNQQTLALIQGDSTQLTATVFPTNVTTTGVKWTTSNSAVATVDNNGTVVGMGSGAAIITATANDGSGKYADCVVAVTAKVAVESVTLNLASFNLLLNDTTTLVASVLPKNATYGKLVWSSSDTNVATVDEKGKVSGLKLGNTIITCKAGDKSVSITVTVANTLFSAGTVVNCARRVNVRAKASGASKSVGYAYLGDTYKVLNKTGRWYQIQYNATTQAYIWDSYLSSTSGTKGYTSSGAATGGATPAPGTTAAPVTGKTITIINCTNCVNVRSGAGTTYSWVGYANLGETYTYTNLTNGFYEIAYGDTTAYVSASFAKANG